MTDLRRKYFSRLPSCKHRCRCKACNTFYEYSDEEDAFKHRPQISPEVVDGYNTIYCTKSRKNARNAVSNMVNKYNALQLHHEHRGIRNCMFVTLACLLRTDSSSIAQFLGLKEGPVQNIEDTIEVFSAKGFGFKAISEPTTQKRPGGYHIGVSERAWKTLPPIFGVAYEYVKKEGKQKLRKGHAAIGAKLDNGSRHICVLCFQYDAQGRQVRTGHIRKFWNFFWVAETPPEWDEYENAAPVEESYVEEDERSDEEDTDGEIRRSGKKQSKYITMPAVRKLSDTEDTGSEDESPDESSEDDQRFKSRPSTVEEDDIIATSINVQPAPVAHRHRPAWKDQPRDILGRWRSKKSNNGSVI